MAPPHVSGVLNLRGTVVTVIDLAARLGIEAVHSEDRCIVLLQRPSRPVVIIVDRVRDVVPVEEGLVERSADANSFSGLATGIIKFESGPVVLLDTRLLVTQVLLS
jgi:purine-binding chemotaxis protein CheW